VTFRERVEETKKVLAKEDWLGRSYYHAAKELCNIGVADSTLQGLLVAMAADLSLGWEEGSK
jgi:hypothetical protein